jgi:hypothetical protein
MSPAPFQILISCVCLCTKNLISFLFLKLIHLTYLSINKIYLDFINITEINAVHKNLIWSDLKKINAGKSNFLQSWGQLNLFTNLST